MKKAALAFIATFAFAAASAGWIQTAYPNKPGAGIGRPR